MAQMWLQGWLDDEAEATTDLWIFLQICGFFLQKCETIKLNHRKEVRAEAEGAAKAPIKHKDTEMDAVKEGWCTGEEAEVPGGRSCHAGL